MTDPERIEEALASLRRQMPNYTRIVEAALREAQAENEELRRSVLLEMENGRLAQAENERLREALESDPEKWSFQTLVGIARLLLDSEYPADVFTGVSGDPGPVFVSKLREALAALAPADEAKP